MSVSVAIGKFFIGIEGETSNTGQYCDGWDGLWGDGRGAVGGDLEVCFEEGGVEL